MPVRIKARRKKNKRCKVNIYLRINIYSIGNLLLKICSVNYYSKSITVLLTEKQQIKYSNTKHFIRLHTVVYISGM